MIKTLYLPCPHMLMPTGVSHHLTAKWPTTILLSTKAVHIYVAQFHMIHRTSHSLALDMANIGFPQDTNGTLISSPPLPPLHTPFHLPKVFSTELKILLQSSGYDRAQDTTELRIRQSLGYDRAQDRTELRIGQSSGYYRVLNEKRKRGPRACKEDIQSGAVTDIFPKSFWSCPLHW